MIEVIKIKNYALIEDSEIELDSGFNIITGETGAGKSLFINALSLITGEKVSNDVVGKNGSESIIEAIIRPNDLLLKRLRKNNLNISNEDTIVIKRVIGQKNRSYINGNIISISQLKEIMKNVLDICSQHENQSLLESDYQLDILDKYSVIENELVKIKNLFLELKNLENERKSLEQKNKELLQKKDFLEYQLEEIESFKITKEDEKIDEVILQLKNDVKIKELESIIKQNIFSGQGVKSLLKETIFNLKELDSLLNKNYYNDDFKSKVDSFISFLDQSLPKGSVSIDEELVDYYLKRNESLSKIKRKHGTIIDIINKKTEIEIELASLDSFEIEISNLNKKIKEIEKDFLNLANKISLKRKESAIKLGSAIEKNLKDLNIPFAKFKIDIISTEPHEKGTDKVLFLISANRSENLNSLEKIASGGELSRVILAIFKSINQLDKTLLFDEVDAGIGGDTAPMIGKKLQEISKGSQVICITHLPQVAVFGDANYKIEKFQEKNKTSSRIFKLNSSQIEEEIARMLGKSLSGNKAIENAIEMLKNAKK